MKNNYKIIIALFIFIIILLIVGLFFIIFNKYNSLNNKAINNRVVLESYRPFINNYKSIYDEDINNNTYKDIVLNMNLEEKNDRISDYREYLNIINKYKIRNSIKEDSFNKYNFIYSIISKNECYDKVKGIKDVTEYNGNINVIYDIDSRHIGCNMVDNDNYIYFIPIPKNIDIKRINKVRINNWLDDESLLHNSYKYNMDYNYLDVLGKINNGIIKKYNDYINFTNNYLINNDIVKSSFDDYNFIYFVINLECGKRIYNLEKIKYDNKVAKLFFSGNDNCKCCNNPVLYLVPIEKNKIVDSMEIVYDFK